MKFFAVEGFHAVAGGGSSALRRGRARGRVGAGGGGRDSGGHAAGSGPRFSSGEAPGASSREDGAALDERRCLGTTNITRERRGRADDVGLGGGGGEGSLPRRATTGGMPTKNPPHVSTADDRAAPGR